jgi:Leucine-rich repeat (LRR) protein
MGVLNEKRCKNQLSSLPKLPQGLKELHCYKNKLSSLPTILPESLRTLFCYDNKLTYFPNLPEKIVDFYYINNPVCTILDINPVNNTLIKVKHNIKIINNFRHFINSLQFKKQFIKWLWKSREKKIMGIYHPNYLLKNLDENADLDDFLNNW